jgi:hypothetical protein
VSLCRAGFGLSRRDSSSPSKEHSLMSPKKIVMIVAAAASVLGIPTGGVHDRG